MTIFTKEQFCTWGTSEDCCLLTPVQFQKMLSLFLCDIDTAVLALNVIVGNLEILLQDVLDNTVDIENLLEDIKDLLTPPAPITWLLSSGNEVDLSLAPAVVIAAPGAGFAISVRYLHYSNNTTDADVLLFDDGTNSVYANYALQGSIGATRFNKDDYWVLPENAALNLISLNSLATSVNYTVEYSIVAV